MGFWADLKAKRAAKKAQAQYELELRDWTIEQQTLTHALDIFTGAANGEEPADNNLVQKAGELILWTGTAIFHEAGRTPTRYTGRSQGISIPIVAGIRYRVGASAGQIIPGEEMQMDKEQGMVKLTNQRLIFVGSNNSTEWAFAKFLAANSNPTRDDFLFAVSNRKKTSGLRFSPADGIAFSRLLALALYAYEKGLPATIKAIKSEIKDIENEKPKLTIEASPKSKEIEA
jgi:hypothetical protein